MVEGGGGEERGRGAVVEDDADGGGLRVERVERVGDWDPIRVCAGFAWDFGEGED